MQEQQQTNQSTAKIFMQIIQCRVTLLCLHIPRFQSNVEPKMSILMSLVGVDKAQARVLAQGRRYLRY